MTHEEATFPSVTENAGVRGYEPNFVDVGGVRTRYYDIGSGEPIVLVHGGNWSGRNSANDWAPTFEYLSETFRVLALDRIACGMTDNPENLDDPSYEVELNHALEFLNVLQLEKTHIAGFSRGGGLVLRMAVEDPERFSSVIITNSGTFGPDTGDKEFRLDRLFYRWHPDLEPTDPDFTRYWNTQYSHQLDHITDEYCETAAYLQSLPKSQQTAEVMTSKKKVDQWTKSLRDHMNLTHKRIKRGALKIPILYIYGRNDLAVPLQMALSAFDILAQKNTRVRLNIINDCGHMVVREYPKEFSLTVSNFVSHWH